MWNLARFKADVTTDCDAVASTLAVRSNLELLPGIEPVDGPSTAMGVSRRRRTRSSTRKATAKSASLAVAGALSRQVETRFRVPPGESPFPVYRRGAPEKLVSENLLSLAKMAASRLMQQGLTSAQHAFRSFASRKHRCPPLLCGSGSPQRPRAPSPRPRTGHPDPLGPGCREKPALLPPPAPLEPSVRLARLGKAEIGRPRRPRPPNQPPRPLYSSQPHPRRARAGASRAR